MNTQQELESSNLNDSQSNVMNSVKKQKKSCKVYQNISNESRMNLIKYVKLKYNF